MNTSETVITLEPKILNNDNENQVIIIKIIKGHKMIERNADCSIFSTAFNLPVNDKPIKKIIITYEY